MSSPTQAQFDSLASALARQMHNDFGQDPNVGLDVDAARGVIRGLVREEDGSPVWYRVDVDWNRVGADGADAVAYDLLRDLEAARRLP